MTAYYTPTGNPPASTRGTSSPLRAEFIAIQTGFTSAQADITTNNTTLTNSKANKAGDTYTGTADFTGGTVLVPTQTAGDNSTKAASTAFVVATSLNASLPGQTNNAGKYITTNGTTASWGYAANNAAAVFTASGSWTCPAWVTRAKITVVGGGASGGTSNNTAAPPSGAAGGAAIKWATVTPGGVYTVTIGAGGVAAGAGTSTNPAAGGASSVSGTGVSITANGGGSGAPSAGGTATGGDINIVGGTTAVPNGGTASLGGASIIGPSSSTAGQLGGGGAGGAVSGGAGNNGGSGIVIIEY